MEFRIADTFTTSLSRLAAQEQKAVKITVFDLQADPSAPGLRFHRIDASRDPNFWSLRVGSDIRIVIHKTAASFLVAYVDHHDKAYAWAERRRIEAHPRTGAVQIVEVRERVEELPTVRPVNSEERPAPPPTLPPAAPPIFVSLGAEQLLGVGVPVDWIEDIRAATEDRFLDLAEHLPAEAAEALLEFAATGSLPRPIIETKSMPSGADAYWAARVLEAPIEPRAIPPRAFEHPDALRRFRVVENVEELRQALDYPWERWTVFLHPSQRITVDRDFNGPARVAGSAGTGKTVVAIHRAARLARDNPAARVLLTTFSRPLANALQHRLNILLGETSAVVPRIAVTALPDLAIQLHLLAFGRKPHLAPTDIIRSLLAKAAAAAGVEDVGVRFLLSEWSNVVDAWQIDSVAAYGAVPRLGRKNRMGAKQRDRLWPVFQDTRKELAKRGLTTGPQLFAQLTEFYRDHDKPFDHVVVDEAQDLGIAELRFIASIARPIPNALFFAGDLGQRIFQQPFSWKSLGVDIRGRSVTLKVNYRTSHQIRTAADQLLPSVVHDVDGLEESRFGTVSVFNGPEPSVGLFKSREQEAARAAAWIKDAVSAGLTPADIAIFVRTPELLERARAAARDAGFGAAELSERVRDRGDKISIGTMHLAKGLEFKGVIVMGCDDDVLPLQSRVDEVADEVELDDVYETERQLLYVACTRARDRLLLTGVTPGSEFLTDMERLGPDQD